MSAPTPDDPYAGVRQIVVPPHVWPALEAWLATRGCILALSPPEGDDELPTYIVMPRAPGGTR